MKIIMMGTGPFAVPTFRWLLQSSHQVLGLITRPVIDPGRRRRTAANPMRDLAETCELEIFDPASVNDAAFVEKLKTYEADLLVVCDYGQILSRDCLASARKGGINLHASLLPRYRGAAPINWVIFHGESTTGVTVIHMSPKLDAGPSLVQRSIEIGASETAEQLEARLAVLGVDAVNQAIALLESWDGVEPIGELQDETLASRAPRLTKQQGRIDWTRSAKQIFDQIRAFQPWPGSFTFLLSSAQPLRLIVQAALPVGGGQQHDAPGTVLEADQTGIAVACGRQSLKITQLQPAGKRVMTAAEFLRGRGVKIGDRLGNGS